jgi:hypothetical protein
VAEGRRHQIGIEQLLVLFLRELEEGEGSTIGQTEERVAVHAHGTEQFVGLRPRRQQREAQHVLVERAGRFLVLRDVRGVMQALGERRGRHWFLLRCRGQYGKAGNRR